MSLPFDTVLNLTFGLLMALFSLITIGQAARLAALQSHCKFLASIKLFLRSVTKFADF